MGLIEPHGGTLRGLYLPTDEAAAFRPEATEYPAWNLTQRQLCDAEAAAERRLLAADRLPRRGRL